MSTLNIFLFYLCLLYAVTVISLMMNGVSDIGAVGGEENVEIDREVDETVQYSVETDNAFSPLADSARVGYCDMDNPNKRKRFNTGNITSFDSMSQDNKLSAMFDKLSNIEAAQDEMKSMQVRVNRNQLLTYKYLDLETRYRDKNIVIYGLEERERDGIRISTVVRDFFYDRLGLGEEDLYIVYARRLSSFDSGRRRVSKRPILCTFSHYSEVDLVMSEARRLKNTGHAIDRDYPSEIAAARKKLWPEVKQIRSTASSGDSVQLKHPAKIVHNGRVVKDQFPYWDELVKSNIGSDFRYILQEDMLRAPTAFPSTVHSQNMSTQSESVAGHLANPCGQNSGQNIGMSVSDTLGTATNISQHSGAVHSNRILFRVPQIPPPPQNAFMFPTGVPQTVLSTMSQLPRTPRPLSPYMVSQTGLPNVTPIDMPNKDNESQQSQLSPSLLSGVPQHNNPANSTSTITCISSDKSTTTATNVFINTPGSSCSVSRNNSNTRDRSQSVDKHGVRGRPRNVSKDTTTRSRSMSRSVKSRSTSKGPVLDPQLNSENSGSERTGSGTEEQQGNM